MQPRAKALGKPGYDQAPAVRKKSHIFRNHNPASTIQSFYSSRRRSVSAASTPFLTSPSPAVFQQRRVDALVSLQKAAQQITNILELDELLDFVVHRIAVDFGCIESSILLIEGDQFHLAAVHGCTCTKKGERWPVTEGLSGQVVLTGRAHYAPDVSQELHYSACEPGTRSEVVIPLTVGD